MQAGLLLVSSIALMPSDTWPDDGRAFAAATKKLQGNGNALADKFWVTVNAVGYHSPDYREILSLMHSASVIEYGSNTHDRFRVLISDRGARHLLRRIAATEQELLDAKAILLAHWEEATGRPWKEPDTA